MYANIIVDISHEKLDRTFQYIVPAEMEGVLEVGMRVVIPFGRSERKGYVVELTDIAEIDVSKLKEIKEIISEAVSIDRKLIALAYWMKKNYGGTINQALKTVIPIKKRVKEVSKVTVTLLVKPSEALALASEAHDKHWVAQARVLEAMAENPVTEQGLLTSKLSVAASVIKKLEEKGVLKCEDYIVFRNSISASSGNWVRHTLNKKQQEIADSICADIDAGINDTCLIRGITGSGKTEVYMEVIDHVINTGREVIMLIPEIALTYQTVMRFYNRFGDTISIINSRLSDGEKYDRFNLAREGKVKIMIGPRSALFTPFKDLGLVIIDEEQETAYKSENVPKYHARETAIELARMNNAKVILGSATPSLDAFYKAKQGDYKLYTLDERAGDATLADTEIVDLREELKNGNRSMFSAALKEAMTNALEKDEQIMLFLNRRGYSGFINCRDCGNVVKCPHCDVSLTLHRGGRLICHYCGYEESYKGICPKCGSKRIGAFKAGTEQIEEQIKVTFPNASVLRMDLDTTRGKDGHDAILSQFANHEADILVGTQMIVKGHDFPNVTVVGVLLADSSLYVPDYMASERTFDLLVQASGRAGRSNLKGKVIIQTYDPENAAIVASSKQDYEAFYEQEIGYRDVMDYPPVKHMMSVKIASADEALLAGASLKIKAESLKSESGAVIIGPANASIYKINDIFYRMIYYKHSDYDVLTAVKDSLEKHIRDNEEYYRKCSIQFDFR